MFKIGDKAKGFKFDNFNENEVHWDTEMNFYVDKIGEVVETYNDSFVIQFGDTLEWMYPLSMAHLAVVEEKVSPFKIGDKVKFKKSSLDSGMIDSNESCYYKVIATCSEEEWVKIYQNGWPTMYHPNHFEHVKEEAMNTNEEIKWEVGQEVFCCVFGKGKVMEICNDGPYPLRVSFEHEENTDEGYTMEGKLYYAAKNRTLFFSEPQITAELFPPKKPFVPVLNKGDKIVLTDSITDYIAEVVREEENDIYYKTEDGVVTFVKKSSVKIHKLGEEIKFN